MIFILACLAGTLANMYDVVLPSYRSSCRNGCLAWSDAAQSLPPSANLSQEVINEMFINGTNGSLSAKDYCAMPGARAGMHEKDCGLNCHDLRDQWSYIYDSYAGPWCFCKDPVAGAENTSQYCTPPVNIPEQINLQYASSSVVVVGFVTYEPASNTTAPPQAKLQSAGKGEQEEVRTGVTHRYAPPGRNSTSLSANATEFALPYMMHYITLPVTPGEQYNYSVRSGASEGLWSAEYSFRAPGGSVTETRVATYGDMGHSRYNCMQNLKDDATNGLIDVVVHMGDHCYNLGMANDRRGDAYMNAFQPALTTLPWFPIIGNHEWIYRNKLKPGQSRGNADGDSSRHYQAIAWGEAYGVGGADIPFPGPYPGNISAETPPPKTSPPKCPETCALSSTATTALGHHLATGTLYGMGSHGLVPSNTSRYTSADVGLIHMIGLDLNELDPTQLAWLEDDLARANQGRSKTPWIMVMSHFPLFHSQTTAHANMSAAHYIGDENMGEYAVDGNQMKFEACPLQGDSSGGAGATCQTVGEFQAQLGNALQPLFRKYGVDVYNAGHVHAYENTWPLCDFLTGALCRDSNGTELKTFDEPRGTVHITEGNGGVPGVPATFGVQPCNKNVPFGGGGQIRATNWAGCRVFGYGGAYGRITATPTTLKYDRIANNGGSVTDTWTITQHNHGQFPAPIPAPPTPAPTPGPAPAPAPAPGTVGLVWVPVNVAKTAAELPPGAIATGLQKGGKSSYACQCLRGSVCGADKNITGSVSFAGPAHCRIEAGGKSIYLTAPYSFSVLTLVPSHADKPPVWAHVNKTVTSADLPRAVLKVGSNPGGSTYLCRVPAFNAEYNITGSLSYSGGPGHCRVAVAQKAYAPAADFDVMIYRN